MEPRRPFRIYRAPADPEPSFDFEEYGLATSAPRDPYILAAQELLRPPTSRTGSRELEPFSRGWFEELEIKRYAPNGVWLQRVLEFTRHAGESVVMIGCGVGSDAIQYHRHGAQVAICATAADRPDLVRRNFELRGLSVRICLAGDDSSLPYDRGTFDLAYLNMLNSPPKDLGSITCEIYRVLKPGGKVFVLAPAKYDLGFWQDVLMPFRKWYRQTQRLSNAPRYSAPALRRAFGQFTEYRTAKRHLRRSELPHLWRFMPMSLLERGIGHILVLRAFKPITAALEQVVAEDPAA